MSTCLHSNSGRDFLKNTWLLLAVFLLLASPVYSASASNLNGGGGGVPGDDPPITVDAGWWATTTAPPAFFWSGSGAVFNNEGPFTFTSTTSTILSVTDDFCYGDQFEIFDFSASLGLTSGPTGTSCPPEAGPDAAFASPNWSSGTFLLGPGSHSITIKVVQNPHGVGRGYLKVDSVGNRPPVADANGPYVGNEGTSISFDASGSSDPDGDSLEYRWDFDDNGIWDTGWSTSPYASNTWADDWTGTARVEVSDGELNDTATAQVTVNNVNPSVDAGADQTITAGGFVSFNGSFSDPGWLDTHTAEWDYGDGTLEPGVLTEENIPPDSTGTVSGGHSYFQDGEFTVTLKVTDDDGGIGTDTLKVTVEAIAATIDFDPHTLNLSSTGKWVAVHIGLPEGYDVRKIDSSTVLLNGVVGAYVGKEGWASKEANNSNIVSHAGGKILKRMVKFDRSDVQAILAVGDEVQVTVTGQVEYDNGNDTGLADFKGTDTIRVIDEGNEPELAEGDDENKGKDKTAPALKGFTFKAFAAYPSPCNPETWIPYTLAKDVEVTIAIYNSSGRIVRTLQLGHQSAGAYISKDKAAYWDGRNEAGEEVSSGIYFYALKAGNFIATRKLIVLR